MLEKIKEEFLTELASTTTFSGSLFTREDVAKIIGEFADRADSVFKDTPKQSAVNDEVILRIAEIAEQYAKLYAEDCVENYDFSNSAEFETNEYGGELRVSVSVDVDSSDFKSEGSFQDDAFLIEITELLNPKQEA
jgi:hypothetical protein